MPDKKIKFRILPLHNIGGIGKAGDVVWMTEAEARIYIEEGYLEVVTEPEAVPVSSTSVAKAEEADHAILKPRSRRK